MRILLSIGAWWAAAAITFVVAAGFITLRIIADQAAVGADYGSADWLQAYWMNLSGLAPLYGVVVAVALAIGFLVAAVLKRVLRPLAPIAYPLAGAAAVVALIWIVNNYAAPPGVGGAIPGARSPLELALQAVAGAIGGIAFEYFRPKAR